MQIIRRLTANYFTPGVMVMGVMVAVTACGSSAQERSSATLFALIDQRSEMVARAPVPYRTVAEAKPDVVYLVDGASELRFSEAFVSGAVVDVTPGRGFSWTFDDDIETRVEHKFNGEGAQVSTVHLTVSVDHAVTVPSERDLSGSTITVGLALAAPVDLAAIHRELVGGDKIVALLVHSPVFDYEPAVWAVLDDGEFLGRVGSNGAVSFPRSLSERGLVPRDLTLKALSKPAPPGPPIAVSAAGGVLARAN